MRVTDYERYERRTSEIARQVQRGVGDLAALHVEHAEIRRLMKEHGMSPPLPLGPWG